MSDERACSCVVSDLIELRALRASIIANAFASAPEVLRVQLDSDEAPPGL